MVYFAYIILGMVALTLFAAAQVGGQGFLSYYYDMDSRFSDLKIKRTYVDVKAPILESDEFKLRFRYTLDMNFKTNTLFTKFAYLEAVKDNIHFFFGQHITPYTPYIMKNYWRYLFVDFMSHHRYKLTITSDRGFSIWFKHPMFNTHVGIYSGEGFKGHEVSMGKDLMGRFSLTLPGENLKIGLHGYGQVGTPKYVLDSAAITDTRTLFGGAISIGFHKFLIFSEYFTGKNVGLGGKYYPQADVFSIFAVIPVLENCVILRYDLYGSDGLKSIKGRYFLAGYVLKFSERFRVSLNYRAQEMNSDLHRIISIDTDIRY